MRGCGISVLLANVRSIINKRDSLESIIDTCNPDIIALTETWLHPAVSDHEIFNNPSRFITYRCDRSLRHGGGVLIAVSRNLQSYQIACSTCLETVWACVDVGYHKLAFGVCYRPPSYSSVFVDELHDVLSSVVTRHTSASVFLLGDFNYPNISWPPVASTSPVHNTEHCNFLNLCSTFSLTQLVTCPTRVTDSTANILDLVLTSRPDLTSPITYLPGISDHLAISFGICIPINNTLKIRKQIRIYNKADFNSINNELSSFLDCFLDGFDNRSVESNWGMFKTMVHDLTNKYIPTRIITCNPRAAWYNNNLKRLSNRKKRRYRAAKQSQSSAHWQSYKEANTSYLSALKLAKTNFFQNTLPSMLTSDPRKFWRVVSPAKVGHIALADANGSFVPDSECSSMLNLVFPIISY